MDVRGIVIDSGGSFIIRDMLKGCINFVCSRGQFVGYIDIKKMV